MDLSMYAQCNTLQGRMLYHFHIFSFKGIIVEFTSYFEDTTTS